MKKKKYKTYRKHKKISERFEIHEKKKYPPSTLKSHPENLVIFTLR